ncbi:MAG: hypothetical protein BWZ10_00557 [candidate division BRC1 bacterium ADurb.BinA364]|nr:MAG: hypothetical protein BWZ10_00557 [candidate division BRC1 bacterium ADurb.BinA364]
MTHPPPSQRWNADDAADAVLRRFGEESRAGDEGSSASENEMETLAAFVEGRLSKAERKRIERQLRDSAQVRASLAGLIRTIRGTEYASAILDSQPSPEPLRTIPSFIGRWIADAPWLAGPRALALAAAAAFCFAIGFPAYRSATFAERSLRRAGEFVRAGDWRQARQALEPAIPRLGPGSDSRAKAEETLERTYLEEGLAYESQGAFDRAFGAYDAGREALPKSTALLVQSAGARIKQARTEVGLPPQDPLLIAPAAAPAEPPRAREFSIAPRAPQSPVATRGGFDDMLAAPLEAPSAQPRADRPLAPAASPAPAVLAADRLAEIRALYETARENLQRLLQTAPEAAPAPGR